MTKVKYGDQIVVEDSLRVCLENGSTSTKVSLSSSSLVRHGKYSDIIVVVLQVARMIDGKGPSAAQYCTLVDGRIHHRAHSHFGEQLR